MDDLKWWLQLQGVPGVGPALFRELIRRFQSPEGALKAPLDALLTVPRIDRKTAEAVRVYRNDARVERQIRAAEKTDTSLLTLGDRRYPNLLREIPAPPPILFVRGRCELLEGVCVAIVGARQSTPYGRQAAGSLAGELTERGITVVSGMARGIDSAAHRAALEKGGTTVAVLGCGVDVIYPPEQGDLYEAIVKAGAVLSEFPMETGPEPHHFPQRNRIISGLSVGVLVVEASLQSGALLTAQHALEQGREVFAVPGPINSGKSLGPNRLIQAGAKLVLTAEDIVAELQTNLRGTPPVPPSTPAPTLSSEENGVLLALSETPAHIDAVVAATGLPPGRTLGVLLSLEMGGLVRQLPGKLFVRA